MPYIITLSLSTHTSWEQKLFAAASSPCSRFSAENTLIAGHDCNMQMIYDKFIIKMNNKFGRTKLQYWAFFKSYQVFGTFAPHTKAKCILGSTSDTINWSRRSPSPNNGFPPEGCGLFPKQCKKEKKRLDLYYLLLIHSNSFAQCLIFLSSENYPLASLMAIFIISSSVYWQ